MDTIHACSATSPPLVSRWDEVGDVLIHSRVGGAGPAVVLVHGYGVSGRYLLPLASVLAARCATYVPDLPGCGRRGRPAPAMGIGDLADTLGDWLDVVGLSSPGFVANSMGCQIVTELAVRRPHRVGPLVLMAPTIEPASRARAPPTIRYQHRRSDPTSPARVPETRTGRRSPWRILHPPVGTSSLKRVG